MSLTSFANSMKGGVAADSTTGTTFSDVDRSLKTRVFTFMKPGLATSGDDAAAATDTTETPVFVNRTGGTITILSIDYICGATGFTAADATASSLNIFKRDAAGANQLAVATMTTATVPGLGVGTLAVGQRGAFTLTATVANLTVVNGGVLTYTRTHLSTGTVVPGGAIVITYTED